MHHIEIKQRDNKREKIHRGIERQAGTMVIGIVVDSVSEILNIIEETPTFGAKRDTDYILGMAKLEGSMKILLDIDRLLYAEELSLLEEAA